MKLFIDADACPVKDIIIETGQAYDIPVVIVCSISHFSQFGEGVEKIIVDNVSEAADMAIMNNVKAGDVVITQDYGLAAMVLAKGCQTLHHSGLIYTNENIDQLLFKCHLHAKIRKSGGRHKGPKAFTDKDKDHFRQVLLRMLSRD